MKEMADVFGVKGWVRNLDSGNVEAIAEGDEPAVSNLIDWSRQGPAHAAVDNVIVEWREPCNRFTGFSVRH
jgi:acylphosphatase